MGKRHRTHGRDDHTDVLVASARSWLSKMRAGAAGASLARELHDWAGPNPPFEELVVTELRYGFGELRIRRNVVMEVPASIVGAIRIEACARSWSVMDS